MVCNALASSHRALMKRGLSTSFFRFVARRGGEEEGGGGRIGGRESEKEKKFTFKMYANCLLIFPFCCSQRVHHVLDTLLLHSFTSLVSQVSKQPRFSGFLSQSPNSLLAILVRRQHVVLPSLATPRVFCAYYVRDWRHPL